MKIVCRLFNIAAVACILLVGASQAYSQGEATIPSTYEQILKSRGIGLGADAALGQESAGSFPSSGSAVTLGAQSRPGSTLSSQKEDEDKARAGETAPLQEPSSVEEFFSQTSPSFGSLFRSDESSTASTGSPSEEALSRLLVSWRTLTPSLQTSLFNKLDAKQQKDFLLSLAPNQRKSFLANQGEQGRSFFQDLTEPEVNLDLKQFGYNFFATSEGGFSADTYAPVGPDYVVGPGDTLVINVWGSIDGIFEVTVDRNGEISIPKAGTVSVWGQSFAQTKETVAKQIGKYFRNFELNLSMGALRSIQVFVVGEVSTPGTYTVSSLSTVLNALSAAGGPRKSGSLRGVQLVRNGEVVATVDFYNFFLRGDRSSDARLQSGDTIYVPVAQSFVGVAGDVRRPAIYEITPGETLDDVLTMAGGVTSTAYLKKVRIERVEAHQRKIALDVDLQDLQDSSGPGPVPVRDRDLIRVAPIAPINASYVALMGYVARPGQYQFKEGMRVADLIKGSDNLLPFYFPDMAEILRIRMPDYHAEKITFNLGKALAGDPENNLPLQEYDEIHIFSRDEMQQTPEVTVSGAVLNPGSYRYFDNMTVRDLILSAGNVKRGTYLPEAELSRMIPEGKETRTERHRFDLGAALEGDPTQNLVLTPDDHLFVRLIPDFADKQMVKLEGRVLFPGTYAISKGERLSSVLARAGGFAERAYLRGSYFTRESLKQVQKERLDKLIFEQEQEIYRVSSEIAGGAISKEELASAQSLMDSRSQLVDQLKKAPVTGRMVIHLSPLESFKDSEFDIELKDGDTITIPENPQSVTVLGQVYNPVALSYRPGKTVSYYLDKVGGPNKNADADEMFIVRADGTVYSRNQAGMGVKWDSENWRWIAGGFNVTEIYPGDTILVPEKFDKIDVMREVKDISTIIYQMALGAAAVASF